ncbi:leucine-rich repeat domain-containing protein [Sphingobacterium bambusae]|uniref:Disease resistance R13L4/SHOC-2-like LRR domain-containing protein n=1 Tax=Sphingobacterium bambusae TaxID=662858 RepID=A0ABW6BG45_9SPHI|nr:hypothetical protein [Sphingobacterium bambusae]WPL47175.1 hypothetical protein SCB77_14505 [Sphingobacterium bambusae]
MPLFPNLKAISFNEFRPFQDHSNGHTTLHLPVECYELRRLAAIEFKGRSTINVERELPRIAELPDLRYLIFTASNPGDFPRNIHDLKNLRGISFGYDASLAGVKVPSTLEEIEIVSVNDSARVEEALQMIANPKTVKELGLSYFKIGQGVNNSIKFPMLRSVYLYANKIQDLGSFLSSFRGSRHLRNLHVERGSIVSISSALYSFPALRYLTVFNTRGGVTIPDGISKLKNLVHLNLSSNERVAIPKDLCQLGNLGRLDLSYSGMAELPKDVGQLSNLTDLKLEGNRIAMLPNSVADLRKLKNLDLHANPLVQLPSLGSLTMLDSLDLSYCNLIMLPEDIGDMKNLRYLSVENNFLKQLPSSIMQLKNLHKLVLAYNLLAELSEDIGLLEELENLDVSVNHLKQLPASIGSLKRLKTLNVSHNLLTTMPDEIGTLSSLEYLQAQNNVPTHHSLYDGSRKIYRKDDPKTDREVFVSSLNSFPKDLSSWSNMKSINLSHNDFSSFDVMKALLTIPAKGFNIDLSNAHVRTLPDSGWDNFLVTALRLNGNQIDTLPEDIVSAPILSVLNLQNNNLPKTPKNYNTHAGKRNEVLLYFEQVGLLHEEELPKNNDMAVALMEKSYQYFLYDKDYRSSLEMYQKALRFDPDVVLRSLDVRNLGEAYYHMQHYREAIHYLTRAIQQDTVGPVRIMNFVVPDFEYRAKSYLALQDTSSALQDYLELAQRFDRAYWTHIGMLYQQMSLKNSASEAYQRVIDYYQTQIDHPDVNKDQKELAMLCIMETYILSHKYDAAGQYAKAIDGKFTEENLLPIFDYLKAVTDLALGKQTDFSPALFKGKVSRRWGYDLLLSWLKTAKLEDSKSSLINDMTATMLAKRTK